LIGGRGASQKQARGCRIICKLNEVRAPMYIITLLLLKHLDISAMQTAAMRGGGAGQMRLSLLEIVAYSSSKTITTYYDT
jgi:hypothetical protein